MEIKLFDNHGKPQKVQQSGLGNRPATYPFRQMLRSWYFTVPASDDKDVRRAASMKLYSASSQFASRNPEFELATEFNKDKMALVVTRTK